MDCILCRYGELALKGKNRALFENCLVDNIRNALKICAIDADVRKVRGRIFIDTEDTQAITLLTRTFGLISISPCVTCDSVPGVIQEKVVVYSRIVIGQLRPKTFRMTTKRIDKTFPKTSNEMDILLGDSVDDSLEVSLKDPDLNIGVEIHDKTYVFHERIPCPGGLPLGITGKVAVLIKDEQSIAAAWLMMKRGCEVITFLLKDHEPALVESLSRLELFSSGYPIKPYLIPTIDEINIVISQQDLRALALGDTIDSFTPSDYSKIRTTILTPLIAYAKEEISSLLEKIK